ncbi:type I pullulanase [Neolewinella agarilytica]|uniref:Pullulanase n=1 Tax=Neolewinella agarilytica TaxID=478744 RepID=A0A1H9KGF6_9BACT|nr:pullulanase [Neolewinella agarilytica]
MRIYLSAYWRRITFLLFPFAFFACQEDLPVYDSFAEYPVYAFDDLGMVYTPEATSFKLWSPTAKAVRLRLYDSDDPAATPRSTQKMKEVDGAWSYTAEGDLDGTYYTFQIKQNGRWLPEDTDPYARAVGTNGARAQVINLADTDPEDWDTDIRPALASPTDAVIYELHLRDISLDPRSGIMHKGKFLGLTETGTTTPQGDATGLDHLKELGVTHVHLLPSFDFMSVNEAQPEVPQFNWGYDPQNYNVPEGSYATDPSDGRVRIREFKQMVLALHRAGIRVIMDVVYNHTGRSEDSHFQNLIPDYFYRFNEDGTMSNASGCGNEIASDRPMVRKYIRESVEYWAREYHIDGFRFDLMGIHDIPTMNEVSQALHAIEPSILVYGEGWTAGDSPLPDSLKALKANTPELINIAAFSDDLRDGLKGSVFNHEEKGFVSGAKGKEMSIRFGVVGSTQHPQINYDSVNYSNAPWAKEPSQCINYVSCHDNHTLWDRLAISNGKDVPSRREQMHRLALAVVLTSQGIPFLHAGSEMCRTKNGNENSYNSGDGVNAIRWNGKRAHKITYEYVRGLIALRKAHPAFRMGETDLISRHLTFIDTPDEQLVAYRIQQAPNDDWADIVVAFNGSGQAQRVPLPAGNWSLVVNGRTVNPEGIGGTQTEWTYLNGGAAAVLRLVN